MTGRPKLARAQITHFCVPEMLIAGSPAAAQIRRFARSLEAPGGGWCSRSRRDGGKRNRPGRYNDCQTCGVRGLEL